MISYNSISVRSGEIWLVSRFYGVDSMLKGKHLVVITQNKVSCITSPNITVVPLSSKYPSQPTHIKIIADKENGLIHDSIAQCESINTLSKSMLGYRIGNVSDMIMTSIFAGIIIHIGMEVLDRQK